MSVGVLCTTARGQYDASNSHGSKQFRVRRPQAKVSLLASSPARDGGPSVPSVPEVLLHSSDSTK
eukprot:8878792-Alexandrium_andersonii.AAC.1